MPGFRRGDVVKVPFPYTDRPTRQHRPDDLAIGDLKSAGLPAPSVIRTAKIATIEAADATKLGRVPPTLYRQVASRLSANLGS